MTVKLLTEQYLEFLSLKGGCTGWPESILVEMPYGWKSHVTAHMILSKKLITKGLISLCMYVGWYASSFSYTLRTGFLTWRPNYKRCTKDMTGWILGLFFFLL